MQAIADLDADVITIETARSDMALITQFENFDYPNEIGADANDTHSPIIPDQAATVRRLRRANRLPDGLSPGWSRDERCSSFMPLARRTLIQV
jgi:methionine synthase II (cobalamin-independent)